MTFYITIFCLGVIVGMTYTYLVDAHLEKKYYRQSHMNLRNTCPDIPDDWKGNIADTCRVLGGDKPVTEDFLRKYARLGRRNGGIDWKLSKSGKMIFYGKEIKRFWREH